MIRTPTLPHQAEPSVGRSKANKSSPGSGGHQVAFRAPADLYAELDDISGTLGLDMSNLVRMILIENLHVYRAKADEVRRKKEGK